MQPVKAGEIQGKKPSSWFEFLIELYLLKCIQTLTQRFSFAAADGEQGVSYFKEDSETPSGILMQLASKRDGMNNAEEILCRHTLQMKTPSCGCFIGNAMYK